MTDKMVRVAVYARVSTQEQAVEGTSLEHQSEQLEAYCKLQGWAITGRYIDPGYTGKDAERPGLKRLLADGKLGLFGKVVVFKLDRLSRNLRLLLELEEKLKECGVALFSIKESIDTSFAIGRTVFQVLGLVSEWERENIIERTKAGKLQRYREGCWAGGRHPYGYDYDKDTKKLIINKGQSAVVKRIYQLYSNGKSMSYIAGLLNDEKVPLHSMKSKAWRPSSIRNIIVSPTYIGTQYVNHHTHISQLMDKMPKDAIKIKVPRIVSNAVWQSANDHRKHNRHLQPQKREPSLLQGLITCGVCGYAFMVQETPTRKAYSCRGRLKANHPDGSRKCAVSIIKADWLEEKVWSRIEEIINDPNKLKSVLEETIESLKNRDAELSARIRPVNDELARIQAQKARLAEEWVMMSMDPAKCREIQRSLEREETRLNAIKGNTDPAQIEELERTQGLLRFWKDKVNSMAWNTENEDGSMVRLVDKPHRTVLALINAEDKDISDAVQFPAVKRELLDMLQMRLVAYDDRVEVKAIFPIETISRQLCTSS